MTRKRKEVCLYFFEKKFTFISVFFSNCISLFNQTNTEERRKERERRKKEREEEEERAEEERKKRQEERKKRLQAMDS